jgi:adenosylmethionine-8-amino-7-oxononanoate aminotransferase
MSSELSSHPAGDLQASAAGDLRTYSASDLQASAADDLKASSTGDLQAQAKRHLWMHFTRMGAYEHAEVPVIVRGEGCYVYDEHGKRYLDGLSALFCVNVGHGRAELGEAAAEQARELGFYTNWSYAHPRAIELATRIAELAPGSLERVFFTSGGSEAVESAWKLAKAYHAARGEPTRRKLIARRLAYHGTSMGALAATGLTGLRAPFEPLTPGGVHVPNTNSYRWKEDRDPLWAADAIEEAILFEGPDTVAAVILEPVQNGGGCFVPQEGYFQRVREICDRHGVLLISDEVICSWGRIGTWFGCERYGYEPDMITTAKGITSAYAPLGAVIASDRVAEPFMHGQASFNHGFTFGGHPVACAVALANIEILERERLCERVREQEGTFRAMLEGLRNELPIVGDVRGAGYFHALELVKDPHTKETFGPQEAEELLRGFLSGELYRRGLICRTDDRGDPVVQLSPPLIAGEEQFEEIGAILRAVLGEAWERVQGRADARRPGLSADTEADGRGQGIGRAQRAPAVP